MQKKKNKEKVKHHMSGKKQSIKNESDIVVQDYPETVSKTADHQIVLETIDNKPMDIEDAVIELHSGDQSFFVFNNARTEQINVLYKHNNGKIGLIQPKG
ncbi:MAG: sigma 54 modulation/S30EA ribosomal C-terminal domain-containing protein [Desulfobacula sp.]